MKDKYHRMARAIKKVLELGEISVKYATDSSVIGFTFEPWETQEMFFKTAIKVAGLVDQFTTEGDFSIIIFTPNGVHRWPTE